MSSDYVQNLKRSIAAMRRLFSAFFLRLVGGFAFTTLLVVSGSCLPIWLANKSNQPQNVNIALVLFAAGFFGLVIVGLQTYLNYRNSKFNVSLAVQYMKVFFDDSKKKRFVASQKLLLVLDRQTPEEKMKASEDIEIEPVLDILEDIGFLVHGVQMSDEVAFHYFSHWITIYVQPIEDYLLKLRAAGDTKYCNLLPLLDRMRLLESIKSKRGILKFFCIGDVKSTEAELRKDLGDERDDCKPDDTK